MATTIYIPTNSVGGLVPFAPHCLQHLFLDLFGDGHSDQCAVIPQCSLDLFDFSKVYLGLNPIKSGNVVFVI